MEKEYNKWEKFYHRFNTIFHGIVAISLIPFAYIFLETQKEFADAPMIGEEVEIPLKIVLTLLVVGAGFYSKVYFKKIIGSIVVIPDLTLKLSHYLRLKLIQYGILECGTLLALVGLYVSKDQWYTALYLVLIFAFSLFRPTYDLVIRELKISSEEEACLKKGDF
ncbi:MAG: hypothetical protein ACI8WP_001516 [Flavobacteriaceae bacterium]|jgi:hypothetical protein